MKRLLRRLAIGLCVLFLLAGATLLWMHSGMALRYAVAKLESRTGGALTVGEAEGTLFGPFTLRDVKFESKALSAEADHLTVDWHPLGLASDGVYVHRLELEGLRLHLKHSEHAAPLTFPLHLPAMPRLPARIVLEQVSAQDFTLYTADGSAPLHLDRLGFTGHVDNRSIILRQLNAQGPGVALAGQLEFAPRQGYRLQADLDWRWQHGDYAALAGHTHVHGDAHELALNQTLEEPYALSLNASLSEAFTAPRWQGELRLSRVSTARINPAWPAYTTGADLRFRGDLKGTTLTGGVQADGPRIGPLDARVNARLNPRHLEFKTLSIKLARTGSEFELKGTVRLAAGAPASLAGSWRNIAWPLDHPWLRSPQGRLRLDTDAAKAHLSLAGALAPRGGFDASLNVARAASHAWTLAADTHGPAPRIPVPKPWMKPLVHMGTWRVAAHGDADTAHVDRLAGDWLDGTLQSQALYSLHTGRWQMELHLKHVDPGLLSEDWPGRVDADLTAAGGTGSGQALEVKLSRLTGALRGKPVEATARVALLGHHLRTLGVDGKLGDDELHLETDLRIGEKITWRVDAPTLTQMWPDAAGALKSEGKLDTGKHHALLQLALDGQDLVWRRYQIGTMHAEARISGPTDSHVLVSAKGILVPGAKVASLDASADGDLDRHALKLDLASNRGALKLAGTGDFDGDRWRVALAQVEVEPAGAGIWQAAAPWQLTVDPDAVTLTPGCLTQADAKACGGFDWHHAAGWKARAELTQLPLEDLQTALPSGLRYRGLLHAVFDAGGGTAGNHATLDANLMRGSVQNQVQGKSMTLLAYTHGTAHLSITKLLTTVHVHWQLADGGELAVDATAQHGDHPSLSGRIHGQFQDFELLPAFLPQVSSASGKLNLDVGLSGTPQDPQFSGTAAFDDGDLTVPLLGVHMQGVSLHLTGNASQLELTGSANSGAGKLTLSANGQREAGVWHGQGKLSGDGFRVVDIPEAQVDVSPDLGFRLDNHDVYVDGAVTIPDASLRPRNLTTTAQISPDQVIVGEGGGPPQEKWHVHASVRAILGRQVRFEGFGLSGDIGGEVLAVDEPGHITTGSGALVISDGVYSIYKQQLRIDNGRLLFNGGPISDPALDIRALRVSSHPQMLQPGAVDQKVGVIVRGTLRAPKVSIFSDPPLPQAQATNYLLFGNAGLESSATTAGSNVNTAGEGADLPNFSTQLGGGSGEFDVSKQNVQNASGMQTASLFFGKYLSPRLYISYGVGLYEPITVKRLIYKLSDKWTLQAESGVASSADIIYTLEH